MSKKRRIITYLSVGLILGFVTYYIVEVVVKLLNKHTLKEALISTKAYLVI
jgi:predicted PurR-regulated permease PerM